MDFIFFKYQTNCWILKCHCQELNSCFDCKMFVFEMLNKYVPIQPITVLKFLLELINHLQF